MRQLLSDVMDLQPDWTVNNTEEMQVRGTLIRHEIPDWLRDHAANLGVGSAYSVRGQDAVGRKSQVPWVRVYDPVLSPRPTEGWYVVYLFSSDGARCYLSLSHGSLTWDGSAFRPRNSHEMQRLREWAREAIRIPSRAGLVLDLNLAAQPGTAGAAYSGTVAVAIEYQRSSMPSDEEMLSDLAQMLDLLDQVYVADASDPTVPGREPAEIALANEELAEITKPFGTARRTSGQGFRVTKDEQRAVERRAVEVSIVHYIAAGWSVMDVGATESFDLDCRRADQRLYVEVKGTTSSGESVILTRNEVALHRARYPNNALAVVSEIALDRSADQPLASGGNLRIIGPWLIDDDSLAPIAFTYTL